MAEHNIGELEILIDQHLDKCSAYPNVCKLMQTNSGKDRVRERIKQIILVDGITSIETAIASVETELIFSE